MTQRWSLEVKVGALIVTGLGLFIFFLFAFGDFSVLFEDNYELRVVFDSANGITNGSPVQYAGVEVGKVQGVRLLKGERAGPKVELIVRLPRRVEVRPDDAAEISTFGLLGEKYLEITPGPGAGPPLQPGEQLVGKPIVSTEDIIKRSNDVLAQLKETLDGINNFVGDPEAHLYLKEAFVEARDATRQWKLVGERMNLALSHIEAGEGNIGKLLYDDRLYEEAVGAVVEIRQNPWKLLRKPKGK